MTTVDLGHRLGAPLDESDGVAAVLPGIARAGRIDADGAAPFREVR